MIPLRLFLSGFLSYHDPVEIDFTAIDLACISGPNGAGKSSLLDAMTWALFGQARKRDDSLINSHPQIKTAEVRLIFGYEDDIYQVQRALPRGKPSILDFLLLQDQKNGSLNERMQSIFDQQPISIPWKPLTERTLRETQAKIESILRMDYETFINASFFLQGKADLFTQQRPADRKRILGSILGLEVWETYRQRASDKRKGIEGEITALLGRIHEIEAELNEEPARAARLRELKEQLENLTHLRRQHESLVENFRQLTATLAEQRRLVATLNRQLEVSESNLDELIARQTDLLEQRSNYGQILSRTADIEKAYAAWQDERKELERWEQVAAHFREQEKRRQEPLEEIMTERARLLQERQSLENQLNELLAQEAALPEMEQRLKSVQNELKDADDRLNQRTSLETFLEEARQRQAEAMAENPRLKGEMKEIKARIDQLTAAPSPVCPLCDQPLSLEDRQRLIDDLTRQGSEMGDRYRSNLQLLQQSEQQVGELVNQIRSLDKVEKERLTCIEKISQITAKVEQIRQLRQKWEADNSTRFAQILTSLEEENFAADARLRLAEVDKALIAIGYDVAAHDQARLLEAKWRAAEGDYLSLERAKAAIQPLDNEIANLKKQISDMKKACNQQHQERDQATASLAQAEAHAPDLMSAESELSNLQERENRLRLEVGAAQQKVDVLKDLKKRNKNLANQRDEKSRLVTQYKQLERAFGKDGVPALLIEQALPQIEARANETLDRLTGGEMSVRFVTQAAFKDKKRDDLRETLDIQISDASGRRDYEMFSGGEAFRINFAIRLALSEVLAQRSGGRLQTLVIDEGFGSQDALGRQRLIEAINVIRQDFAKILVVTHIDELKDAFPTRIEVEKTTRGSMARVI